MCLTPLTIGNPTRRFVRGLSKPLLTVPCGHCKECVERQQDDWFIRSVYESKRVLAKGGAVWFPTLTYNQENLPIWHDDKHDFTCPCFNTDHIISFRNKLRVYLKRKGYDCSGENTIRYMICCEYGSEKGRSHLHCLLYVPFSIPNRIMYQVLKKSWIYGFVMWSKKGMKANGLQASQYCMKYISKEMSWYKQYGVDAYLKQLHDDLYHSENEEEYLQAYDLLKRFRRATPGHRQSMGFGVDGLDYFKKPDGSYNIPRLVDGFFDACKVGLPPMKSGDSFKFKMPMYYARKVFYNLDEYNLYCMNGIGREVFTLRFDVNQIRKADQYYPYTSSQAALACHLAPLKLSTSDIFDLYNSLQSSLQGRTSHDLALFDTVYRDIELTDDNQAFISGIDGMTVDSALRFLSDNALDFMMAQKSIDREPDPERCKNRANFVVSERTFNTLPCFDGLSQVLDTIKDFEHQIGLLENNAYEINRLRQENLFGTDGALTSNLIFDL